MMRKGTIEVAVVAVFGVVAFGATAAVFFPVVQRIHGALKIFWDHSFFFVLCVIGL